VLLERLRLADFRNYASLDFAPTARLNVFVGANAQGKSNLLEAIAMLGTGRSFRTAREVELVRDGARDAAVAGEATLAAGNVRLTCEIERTATGSKKRYAVNGTPVRYAGYLGRARTVTFVPVDLEIVRGGPSLRRSLLNGALSQSSAGYYRHLARYTKIVAQKSALLRRAAAIDRDLLLAYNDALLDDAVAIVTARARYIEELAPAAATAYASIAGEAEPFEVAYAPNIALGPFDEPAVREAVAARLRTGLEAEIMRRAVLIGPHRDDMRLHIDRRPLAAYGSQGQQRTATLALKVAEYGVVRARTGDAPLLLLDDVLSELDRSRAARFLTAIGEYEQAFLTATEIDAAAMPHARRYLIDAATVTAC